MKPLRITSASRAAPITEDTERTHTHPSFEIDNTGLSHWRGKLNKIAGSIDMTLDQRIQVEAVAKA